jgi:hypothetical protein
VSSLQGFRGSTNCCNDEFIKNKRRDETKVIPELKHHAKITHKKEKVKLHAFLTSLLDESE